MTGKQKNMTNYRSFAVSLLFMLIGFSVNSHLWASDATQLKHCQQEQLIANSTKGSRKLGIVEYRGNVEFCNPDMALKAELMTVEQSEQRSLFNASGSPVIFLQQSAEFTIESTSNQLRFTGGQQQLQLLDNVALKLQQTDGSELIIHAQSINYDYLQQQELQQQELQPSSILASGRPLRIELLSANSEKIVATAQNLNYQHQAGLLVLEGDIEFKQAGDIIRAPKIQYNTRTREWEAPKVNNQRIEVILQP